LLEALESRPFESPQAGHLARTRRALAAALLSAEAILA
jgi:hypothetical protein